MPDEEGWLGDQNRLGMPTAVLTHDKVIVARIYESPDGKFLRIVLPELKVLTQLKVDVEHGIIDVRRSP